MGLLEAKAAKARMNAPSASIEAEDLKVLDFMRASVVKMQEGVESAYKPSELREVGGQGGEQDDVPDGSDSFTTWSDSSGLDEEETGTRGDVVAEATAEADPEAAPQAAAAEAAEYAAEEADALLAQPRWKTRRRPPDLQAVLRRAKRRSERLVGSLRNQARIDILAEVDRRQEKQAQMVRSFEQELDVLDRKHQCFDAQPENAKVVAELENHVVQTCHDVDVFANRMQQETQKGAEARRQVAELEEDLQKEEQRESGAQRLQEAQRKVAVLKAELEVVERNKAHKEESEADALGSLIRQVHVKTDALNRVNEEVAEMEQRSRSLWDVVNHMEGGHYDVQPADPGVQQLVTELRERVWDEQQDKVLARCGDLSHFVEACERDTAAADLLRVEIASSEELLAALRDELAVAQHDVQAFRAKQVLEFGSREDVQAATREMEAKKRLLLEERDAALSRAAARDAFVDQLGDAQEELEDFLKTAMANLRAEVLDAAAPDEEQEAPTAMPSEWRKRLAENWSKAEMQADAFADLMYGLDCREDPTYTAMLGEDLESDNEYIWQMLEAARDVLHADGSAVDASRKVAWPLTARRVLQFTFAHVCLAPDAAAKQRARESAAMEFRQWESEDVRWLREPSASVFQPGQFELGGDSGDGGGTDPADSAVGVADAEGATSAAGAEDTAGDDDGGSFAGAGHATSSSDAVCADSTTKGNTALVSDVGRLLAELRARRKVPSSPGASAASGAAET